MITAPVLRHYTIICCYLLLLPSEVTMLATVYSTRLKCLNNSKCDVQLHHWKIAVVPAAHLHSF